MKKELFGKTKDGKDVFTYTMSNQNGMAITVMNFGAILKNIFVPDKTGKVRDIALCCDCIDTFYENLSFFGSTVGPSANRIAGAEAVIDGVTYKLCKNDGDNNLHSDILNGLNKRLWNAEEQENKVIFTYSIKDGEMNLPGNRSFSVAYSLTEENEVKIEYYATSDKNTIINMTNHSYFNFKGHNAGDITSHEVQLNASYFTEIVAGAIPTGKLLPVKGTPMDFTSRKKISKEVDADYEQMKLVKGYDHNFVVDNYDGTLREIAQVWEEESGINMKVFSDLPGVQFYTGNNMERDKGKDDSWYNTRYGLCLETQYFPDSVHHDNFPSTIFGPDRAFKSTTIYQFNK